MRGVTDHRVATEAEAREAAEAIQDSYGVRACAAEDPRYGWKVVVSASSYRIVPAVWSGVVVHRQDPGGEDVE